MSVGMRTNYVEAQSLGLRFLSKLDGSPRNKARDAEPILSLQRVSWSFPVRDIEDLPDITEMLDDIKDRVVVHSRGLLLAMDKEIPAGCSRILVWDGAPIHLSVRYEQLKLALVATFTVFVLPE